ncbi:hypothetical protein BGC07_18415 [Piscirickettsia litoralis]|uniref:Uncharacterized protein n=1 Tax=Piscirickettsia litoralis TaxID=1891921 RepID=A0ABX2ZWP2_9GAMM|nr:hypothetical protein BGC07_18415 [Piscirickettsia litoralis]
MPGFLGYSREIKPNKLDEVKLTCWLNIIMISDTVKIRQVINKFLLCLSNCSLISDSDEFFETATRNPVFLIGHI